jgi:hypothetical protein
LAFDGFGRYAPGVSLTAIADRHAFMSGQIPRTGSGFRRRGGVEF